VSTACPAQRAQRSTQHAQPRPLAGRACWTARPPSGIAAGGRAPPCGAAACQDDDAAIMATCPCLCLRGPVSPSLASFPAAFPSPPCPHTPEKNTPRPSATPYSASLAQCFPLPSLSLWGPPARRRGACHVRRAPLSAAGRGPPSRLAFNLVLPLQFHQDSARHTLGTSPAHCLSSTAVLLPIQAARLAPHHSAAAATLITQV
jgi:hypothetical protein